MKKIIALVLAVLMLTLALSSCSEKQPNFVLIDVEEYGQIVVELYPDIAPITVANFKKLVSEGFYDGLIFHRVYEGFMIQGGGFTPDYVQKETATIKGEFAANGIKNDLSHTRGVISMARTNVMDSASSQFFIVHQDSLGLDGLYAAFGKVVSGMEVVDKIATAETTYNYLGEKTEPIKTIVITSVYFVNPEN